MQAAVLRALYRKLFFRRRGKDPQDPAALSPVRQTVLAFFVYGVLGVVSLQFAALDDFAFAASLHAMTFMITGMNMAISSGRLLFNPDETDILLHRPIEPQIMLRCKLQIIIEFTMALATALNLVGLVVAVGSRGEWLFVPAHLFSTSLCIIFCAGMIAMLYNTCLRWFGRERLDGLMTLAQMLFAVCLMAGSQLIPRVVARMDPAVFQHPPAWFAALPPAWFAALDLVLCGRADSSLYGLATLAVAATAAATWIGQICLAGAYERGLSTLSEVSTTARQARRRRSFRLSRLPLLRLWLRDPVERSTFDLTLAGLSRARDVKLRVYPILGQFILSPLIILASVLSAAVPPPEARGALPQMAVFQIAFAGAYLSLIPLLVLEHLRASDHWRAAEIFHQAPLDRPGALFQGVRKAVLCVISFPGLLALAAATFFWLGPQREMLLLLPGALLAPVVSLTPGLMRPYLVFSDPPRINRGALGCALLFGFMLGASIMASLCWLAWTTGWFLWLLVAEALFAALGCVIFARILAKQQLTMTNE